AGLGARAGDVVAFGHTHVPWHRVVGDVHFVNTGSVGRPKDGDWRAGYVVIEFAGPEPSIEFRRVEYDVDLAAKAILDGALPSEFAEYLRTGGKLAATR